MKAKTKTVDSTCRGCVHLAKLGDGTKWCDYIGATARRRPCPAGKGCTVRETGAAKSTRDQIM